jgi:predicted TIM-barrel enzyme
MENKLKEIFHYEKPIIGMIHLAGETKKEKIKRALEELTIFEEQGVNGAIIEDYHGMPQDVYNVLEKTNELDLNLVLGINVLREPYCSFALANNFNAKFVQFDSVQTRDLDLKYYDGLREQYPKIAVLGGVGFKYVEPTGNPLEQDLNEAKPRCEAIVTTGSGTGVETPTNKLKEYKQRLGTFPLIVGAGVDLENIYEQLQIVDGAIVGSYFKPDGITHKSIDKSLVKDLIDVVKQIRK